MARVPWIDRAAKCAAVVLILLLAPGYVYEHRADNLAARQHPMRGVLIDLGGYRLHLYCLGSGRPTVVLDAGFVDSLEQWDLVQPEVAKSTRVCSYDRAGSGWSDLGSKPRNASHEALELHTLLTRAGERSPFVVVGHSYSGLIALIFASSYRSETEGMVLVDSVAPDEMSQFPAKRFVIPSYQILLLRLAAVWGGPRLIGLCGATGAIPDCPRFIRAEMDNLKAYGESHREAGEITGLDKITLVVLAHDPRVGLAGPRDDAFESVWNRWHEMTRLSSNSSFVEVSGVGHEIQTDQPEVVTGAIVRVVEAIRSSDTQEAAGIRGTISPTPTRQ